MGKIIAVVSGKGGTGKTSFTANVGLALAALGCHTLCLDCDITLRNLDLALGLSDRASPTSSPGDVRWRTPWCSTPSIPSCTC